MDADGLPLVGPGVDYSKVEAIQQKRIVAFLNHFVTHTAKFLNKFSSVCEEKLEHMTNRIQELEISMNLLEAKLSSIPGLENVTAPSSSSTTTTDQTQASSVQPAPSTSSVGQPAPSTTQTTIVDSSQPPVEEAPPVQEEASNPVSKDPRYIKFFKMVQFGVPAPAVKLKMRDEGLDPDMLDTPDAPAPADDDVSDNNSDSDEEEDDDEDW